MISFVWFQFFLGLSAGIILSKSTLLDCRRNESIEKVLCSSKVIANFALSSNLANSDELVIKELPTETATMEVQSPIVLKLRKPEAHSLYHLKFLQAVHGKPKEEFFVLNKAGQCKDYRITQQVCPPVPQKIAEQYKAKRKVNAEGFCCPCREANKFMTGTPMGRPRVCASNLSSLESVLGSVAMPAGVGLVARGLKFSMGGAVMGLVTEWGARFFNKTCSIHCMNVTDENWYGVFEIEPAETRYTVEVEVDGHVFTMTQNETDAEISIPGIDGLPRLTGKARIIGDYAGIRAPKSFHGVKFVAPITTSGKFDDLKTEDLDWQRAYIIPNAYFELSGNTCNKIGVSDVAFNIQTNMCTGETQECLDDQIDDLIKNGIARPVFENKTQDSDVESYSRGYFGSEAEIDRLNIKCKFQEAHVSRVNLSLYAEDLVALVGDPPVAIESYKFDQDACDSDKTCKLILYIRNLDDTVEGSYFVGVENFKQDEHALNLTHGAVSVGIMPNHTQRVVLEFVLTEDVNSSKTFTCDVVVTSESDGTELARVTINVEARAAVRDGRDDHLMHLSNDDQSTPSAHRHETCKDCKFMDISCLVRHICLAESISQIMTGALALALAFVLLMLLGPMVRVLTTSVKFTMSALKPLTTGTTKPAEKTR